MELEPEIYRQYRDTPFRIEVGNNRQNQEDEINNSSNLKAYNEYLNKIQKSLDEPHGRRLSDNIKLRASFDKSRQYYEEDSGIFNNNSRDNEQMNAETMKRASINNESLNSHKFYPEKNDKRRNIAYLNNIYNNEIEEENIKNNQKYPLNKEAKNDNKVICEPNNVGGFSNFQNNNNNYINNEETNKYYKPFNNNDIEENGNNINKNGKYNIPNITLSVLKDDNNTAKNNGKKGFFSGFSNLFHTKKKEKETHEEDNNYLETIDQKMKADPDTGYINQNNNSNEKKRNNIVLSSAPKNEENNNNNYNYILSNQQEKDKSNSKEIKNNENEPKDDEEEGEDLIEYSDNEYKPQEKKDQKHEGFVERQNIYHYSNELNNDNNNENDKDKKGKCIFLKAEPIEMRVNDENVEVHDDLGTAKKESALHKVSQYTLKILSNFVKSVKKHSKLINNIVIVLLGIGGIIFLFYKCKKIRELLLNLLEKFKIMPECLKGLLPNLGQRIGDFLEKYNDIYRLLGDLVMLIIFWIIFKLLMKCVCKSMKKRNRNPQNI